jgi:putative oxidoreductase
MNIVLWVLQVLLGLYFLFIGVMHFVIPPGLPAMMAWMYELSPTLHTVSGIAEILGGLGLILPSVTKIQPRLTPLAGTGLILVMIGALIWHVQRGEMANLGINIGNIVMLAFVAYGRWKLAPIGDKNTPTTV